MSIMNQTEARVALANISFRARQARDAVLGSGLFGDPAWDIVLAFKARGSLTRAQLRELTGLADSLVDRWVAILQDEGLVEDRGDNLGLSEIAVQKLDRIFDLAITDSGGI